jgi:DNA-binding transcriptional ArsR family regulator
MARSPTTADAFNAIAEPRRRQIIALLARAEQSVNDIAGALGLTQPQASKHLAVLKAVGLVRVRGAGRRRIYALNATALKPVHDWLTTFARLWDERLNRLDDYLTELQAQEKPK